MSFVLQKIKDCARDTAVDNSFYKNGIAQEDNDFKLTPDQEHAVKLIENWFKGKGGSATWKRFFVLAGSAGTGKSSLVQYIVKQLSLIEDKVLCCAFTGKASLNLQRKGNYSATLHSSIYDCEINPGQTPIFYKKNYIPFRLVIVDEASMISEEIFDDLLSFGVPVVFIGDHCQLPPVQGDFNIMLKPDYTLTTILRQAAKSPIIRASQLAIKGQKIPFCNFQGFRKIRQSEVEDTDFLWADQIIVGTNSMRKTINDIVREIKGIKSISPKEDERMIVLRNNRNMQICNGQIVYLKSPPKYDSTESCYRSDWLDELEEAEALLAVTAGSQKRTFKFKLKDPMKENAEVQMNQYAYLDFGYAISCHKSQGSGWEKVMIFDEGFGFDQDTKRRWLYTAITRAKKEILIVSK